MRLPQASLIKSIIQSYDPEADIYLFGSRTDDTKKGGDIDLLVLSKTIDLWTKILILDTLYLQIGEQKIDLIITPEPITAFHKHAHNTGIKL